MPLVKCRFVVVASHLLGGAASQGRRTLHAALDRHVASAPGNDKGVSAF